MSIKPYVYILVLMLNFLGLKAQEERDFQDFSKDVYSWLSDTGAETRIEYIRLKTWKQLINEQEISQTEKNMWIHKKEQSYYDEQKEFSNKLGNLINSYRNAVLAGAKMEYLESGYDPHPKWKKWYSCYFRFFLEEDGLETIVQVDYQLYFNGKGLMFLGTDISDEY